MADYINVVAAAMKQAGSEDKEKVQQALMNLKDLPAFEGTVSFTPEPTAEGIHGWMVLWQIKNGKYDLAKIFPGDM